MIHFLNAGNGDAILIQSNDNGDCKHILIDGGKERNTLTNRILKQELLSIIDDGKKGSIDLVIVTHSDDDHIGGILNLVGDPTIEKHIKKYIFHAEKYIAQNLGRVFKKQEKYIVKTVKKGSEKSSYRQDKELTKVLEQMDGKWDNTIFIAESILKLGESIITFLSPNNEKLNILQTYWEHEKKKYQLKNNTKKSNNAICKYDYSIPISDFSFDEKTFKEEDSETNGSSIAVIYEELGFKALLLADAHPSVVEQSLKNLLSCGETNHKFDVVKLSHHGSKFNITPQLLKLIQCENFVISANANKSHRHPDKATLALIIKHYGKDNVRFYFTNDNAMLRSIFKNEDFENYFFPKKGANKITVPYES